MVDAAGQKQWYIVHTYSGFEERVRENLTQRIEALLPGAPPAQERHGVSFVDKAGRLGGKLVAIDRDPDSDGVVVRCDDGRVVHSTHAVLAIGSVPNSDDLGLDAAGIAADPELARPLREALAAFARAIEGFKAALGGQLSGPG